MAGARPVSRRSVPLLPLPVFAPDAWPPPAPADVLASAVVAPESESGRQTHSRAVDLPCAAAQTHARGVPAPESASHSALSIMHSRPSIHRKSHSLREGGAELASAPASFAGLELLAAPASFAGLELLAAPASFAGLELLAAPASAAVVSATAALEASAVATGSAGGAADPCGELGANGERPSEPMVGRASVWLAASREFG